MSSFCITMTHLLTFLQFVLLVTQGTSVERISIPHDVLPGYSIKQLHSRSRVLNSNEGDISPYFAILDDGYLISTTKLCDLADSYVNLIIQEDQDDQTIIKPIIINIRDRSKMMKFSKRFYTGSVSENEPPSTAVEGLSDLTVWNGVGNVSYILSGDNAFALIHQKNAIAIISTKVLDREVKRVYLLQLNATDSEGCVSSALIKISVNDVNDNAPVFAKKYYSWNIKPDFPIHSTVGKVKAIDADGDKPVYKFNAKTSDAFVIVPQTGEVILMRQPELGFYSYYLVATDDREAPMYSDKVLVTIVVGNESEYKKLLTRRKRATRQTRMYEHFLESDGSIPGKVMFRLESVHSDEIFSLENETRWIDVDHNGDVKVREPWDYEQLEREKTIDFWVQIRAPHQPGKFGHNFIKISLSLKKKGLCHNWNCLKYLPCKGRFLSDC